MKEGFVKNTLQRVGSALVALPIYIYAVITDSYYNIPLLLFSLVIVLISLYEYYQISTREDGGRPFILPGMITGALVCLSMYYYAFGKVYAMPNFFADMDARLILLLITFFIMVVLITQIFFRPIQQGSYSVGSTVFGVVYIALFFSHILLLKALTNGLYYILILNFVIMLNDTGAYFGGLLFGKHKTNFPVSPNKSWEGYFSGLLFSIIGMILSGEVLTILTGQSLFTIPEAALLGVVLSLLGSIGDLVESAFKRDGSIKDSGSIIPGHGGMWDVFDAMIFSMPFFYYYLILKGVH